MSELPLPSLHDAASASSEAAQRRFLRGTRVQLVSLIVAAIGSVVSLKQGDVEVGAAAALAGFVVALSVRGYLLATQPAKAWYEGRAAAESVKTLAWRYAVGGHPFVTTLSAQDADVLFVTRCQEVLNELSTLDLGAGGDRQITAEMDALRARSLAERKAAYERGRIADQQAWYGDKATSNQQRSQRWQLVLVGLEIAGLVAAIARVADWMHVDILGIAAACSAAATAWLQTRQHEQLAAAYALTAQELANVRTLITHGSDTPESWAVFVQDAEEAISREHTMWKASRGVRLP